MITTLIILVYVLIGIFTVYKVDKFYRNNFGPEVEIPSYNIGMTFCFLCWPIVGIIIVVRFMKYFVQGLTGFDSHNK